MSEIARKSWRPGLMPWLVIAGLILVNAAVFFSDAGTHKLRHYLNPWHWPGWYAMNLWFIFAGLLVALFAKNKRVQTALHSFFTSHIWKTLISRLKKCRPNQTIVNFFLRRRIGKRLLRKWLVFLRSVRIERCHLYVWMITCLAVCIVIFSHSNLTSTPRQYLWFSLNSPLSFFYHKIYLPYYLGPLVDFNFNGKITWRLFIAPMTGLVVILCLLRTALKSQKKRRVS